MKTKTLIGFARACFLAAAVMLMAAIVYRQTPRLVGMAGQHGTKWYGFYDLSNGWYSTAVVVSMLFLFALTGLLRPRPGRRRVKRG